MGQRTFERRTGYESVIPVSQRPPIGFVVEGHGEYNCYPSLVCKIVEAQGFHVPRVNARGVGNIWAHLGEHLTDLCITYMPYSVIVTIDLMDVLNEGLANDCHDLLLKLQNDVADWEAAAATDHRIQQIPVRTVIVIQVQKFEAWIIADCQSLKVARIIDSSAPIVNDPDGDFDPARWLKKYIKQKHTDIKNPDFGKRVIGKLDITAMTCSNSFDKFRRETIEKYELWQLALLNECTN